MHYRNGREAKNGDKIVKLNDSGQVESIGYCNGNSAVLQSPSDCACIVDCLHVDDVAAVLAEKGLDKRPSSK